MLDWLIIGGGIHGTHLSNVLIHRCGVAADRLVVLDPFEEPMARWRHCTKNTGMTHLRSPVVHHVGLDPMGLDHFAKKGPGRSVASFRPPYARPSLRLFEAHCSHICEEGDLTSVRKKGRAVGLSGCHQTGFRVETDQGLLEARRVVLAMGSAESLTWPGWARELESQGARVWHLFDMDFEIGRCEEADEVMIIGFGISAAQFALRLASKRGPGVRVISRHGLRVHQFDSEPCWVGPRCQVPFRKLKDYRERRQAITEARHRGSMPRDIARAFQHHVQWGRIDWSVSEIESSRVVDDSGIELGLCDGSVVRGDAVVLATGFEPPRPDRSWLAEAMEALDLVCASCGFPIVDEALQWKPGLHVSGPLAELELGPAARNIAGARMTSRRLAAVAGSS